MSSPTLSQSAGEYIARVRYQNGLEAPQCPPKMVEIPNRANAHLLEPSFISNFTRTDSISLDVDAELGMPLDLLHMAGVFEGNEASMRSYDTKPSIHPKDRALLRSVGQLGKNTAQATAGAAAASWLRRTEYISGEVSRSTFRGKAASIAKSEKLRETNQAKRSATQRQDADPVRTLAAILKGFDVANPETAAGSPDVAIQDETMDAAERSWKELRHPNKPHLRVSQTFPLLPDVNATTDAGGYLVFKFATDPLAASKVRDTRIDVGLLRPHADQGDHQADSAGMSFDFYLPATAGVASKIKRKLAAYDKVDRNPNVKFQYDFIRAYETKTRIEHDPPVVAETALTFHTGNRNKPKAAYYYPVVGRFILQPRRTHKFPPGMPLQAEDLIKEQQRASLEVGPPDVLNVRVRDLSRAEIRRREFALGPDH